MQFFFKVEGDVKKKVFKNSICSDAYELISFKLGMMMGMTKLYFLKLVCDFKKYVFKNSIYIFRCT